MGTYLDYTSSPCARFGYKDRGYKGEEKTDLLPALWKLLVQLREDGWVVLAEEIACAKALGQQSLDLGGIAVLRISLFNLVELRNY